jgi:DNA-binding SARP family transcriptional activator
MTFHHEAALAWAAGSLIGGTVMAAEPPNLMAGADAPDPPVLHLFGGPYVTTSEGRAEVPEGSKRLLVFVALRRRRVERRHAAGTLWPVRDDGRASGNLRSALWRLRLTGIDLLEVDKWSLRLCDRVRVDVHLINDWANRLIRHAPAGDDLGIPAILPEALDLLPGWYDEWALMERERIRQQALHALEALSRLLLEAGRHGEAVEAAMMAVNAEPLRESAQRTLIDAHLAEGNWVEGRRAYEAYRRLIWHELGVAPSPNMLPSVARQPERRSASANTTALLR